MLYSIGRGAEPGARDVGQPGCMYVCMYVCIYIYIVYSIVYSVVYTYISICMYIYI